MKGRPRAFDRDQALLLAMESFWSNGFTATSIADLTTTMGIRAPSLYAAFGNKEDLFDEASELYFAGVSANVDRALAQPTACLAIQELLRISAEAYVDKKTPPGCMLMSEPRLASLRGRLEKTIANRIRKGIKDGDLQSVTQPDSIAAYILAVAVGMSRRARDGGTHEDLMTIAEMTLNSIKRYENPAK